VALASSGLHSNGYSLVRKLVEGMPLEGHVDELGRTLGEELLEPTRLYTKLCLEVLDDVHAFAHITGGGLAANVARILPAGTFAIVDRAEIAPPPVFQLMESLAGSGWDALEDALNMGVGMVAAVRPDAASRVIAHAQASGVAAWEIGQVFAGGALPPHARLVSGTKGIDGGTVAMVGEYA
ncbi:MAG: AIR synthase-related protein, partial [Ruaniaceae bacterium]|nr:AIR synthase-related protein [Ruaniaceae bacterium]